jgi:hypothetical protein
VQTDAHHTLDLQTASLGICRCGSQVVLYWLVCLLLPVRREMKNRGAGRFRSGGGGPAPMNLCLFVSSWSHGRGRRRHASGTTFPSWPLSGQIDRHLSALGIRHANICHHCPPSAPMSRRPQKSTYHRPQLCRNQSCCYSSRALPKAPILPKKIVATHYLPLACRFRTQ